MDVEGDARMHDLLEDLENYVENLPIVVDDTGTNVIEDPPKKFDGLLKEAHKELFLGCSTFTRISFIVKLLHLKVYNK